MKTEKTYEIYDKAYLFEKNKGKYAQTLFELINMICLYIKKPAWENFKYIYVDDKNIVSTDGRCMSILNKKNTFYNIAFNNIENGYYEFLKIGKTKIILLKKIIEDISFKFPKYNKIIEKSPSDKIFTINDKEKQIFCFLSEMNYNLDNYKLPHIDDFYLKNLYIGSYDVFFKKNLQSEYTLSKDTGGQFLFKLNDENFDFKFFVQSKRKTK